MLITLFVFPLLAYIVLYFLKPGLNKFLSFWGCLIIALTSLCGLFYAVWQTPLWNKGERVVWSGLKSKTNEIQIGGNSESSSIGWSNEAFAPRLNATTRGNQLNLTISEGGGFVQDLKSKEFLNGEEISLNNSINFSNKYTIKKSYNYLCGNSLEILQANNLIVQIFLFNPSRSKVFNFDSVIEKATQNLTLNGEVRKELYCKPTYLISSEERLKIVEDLKLLARDTRLLISNTGEIRLLNSETKSEKSCEIPCRIKIYWANSSALAELNPVQDKLTFKYLPPYRNFSPIPEDSAAKQLVVTDQLKSGDFAYQLPFGKKESGIRKNLLFNQIQEAIPESFEKVTQSFCDSPNCNLIEGTDYFFSFIRVKDLPNFTWIVILAMLPFVLFIGGLFLISLGEMSLELRCMVGGLVTVVWNFLVFRLLLAIRYALDPAYLDQISIQDLTLSFAGLVFLPSFLFLIAKLRSDALRDFIDSKEANVSLNICLIYLIFAAIFIFIEILFVQTLWKELPEAFQFKMGYTYWMVLIFLLAYLVLHIFIFYGVKQGTLNLSPALRFIFFDLWELPKKFVIKSQEFWINFLTAEKVFFNLIIYFLCYFLSGLIIFVSLLGTLGKDFLPIFFCLIPVILWFAGKSIDQGTFNQSNKAWWKVSLIGIITFSPFILLPVITGDAGSIYANIFILLSLAFILFKKSSGIQVFGWVTFVFTIIGFILVFTFILNFSSFIGYAKFFGKTTPRVLAWKSGDDFQHFLLASDAGSEKNQIGLNYYDVTNVYEHSWENQSIAYNGGFLGNGFGNAPDRLSQIPPSVIQVDSVFSFFVVGDYGWFGGMLLLLLYFMPLLIVFLFHQKDKFNVGFSVSIIICSWFVFEGLLHASMDLGVLPFTGRDLPFLAVHSLKGDFLRWVFLFSVAVFMLFLSKNDETAEVCLLTHPPRSNKDLEIQLNNVKPVINAAGNKPGIFQILAYNFKRYIWGNLEVWKQLCLLLILNFLLFAATVIYSLFYVYGNKSLVVFKWDGLKDDINWAVSKNMLIAVQDEKETGRRCPKIVFNEQIYRLRYNDSGENNNFLKQQVDRFNALSCQERIGEGVFPNITANLEKVSNFNEYEKFLNNLRINDLAARRPKRPNLLAVTKINKTQRTNDLVDYAVQFNPEFNIERTFNQPQSKDNIPNVKIGDKSLIGTAWNKGKFVPALDNLQVLAWTDWLASSMSLEWKRLGSTEASSKYGTLSLDEKLHNQTLNFTDQKGILQHNTKLVENVNSQEFQDKLPSRIGLTVMKLSNKSDNGAILALGSFPRAVAGDTWQTISYGQNSILLPPAKIVEKRFPPYLKQLYGGDRNFEKVSVMGSSTKPMWAAAVISVHLSIPIKDNFKVVGSPVNDDSVFGIKIAKENERWKGHGSKANLVDFDTFLTESNNRYQVLFGFLGLTESKENQKSIPTENPVSNSNLEVMQGNNLWRKYPKFDDQIGFNFKNPESITNLQNTELALRMRRIFGVGTKERENSDDKEDYGTYLNSFWTKNENDDALRQLDKEELPNINKDIRNNFSPTVLPARANLRLNKIDKPRDFVSLLLGGGENQWSNVHAAAGFSSAVIGKPILPNIVQNDEMSIFYGRSKEFVQVSKQLRKGLTNVVFEPNGTANPALSQTGALNFLRELKQNNFQIYAKTGTLTEDGKNDTSRIIMTIVKFEDAEQTKVKIGLTFSLFVEETKQGTASLWLGEYLVQNKADILRILNSTPN